MFTAKYCNNLPDNPVEAVLQMANDLCDYVNEYGHGKKEDVYPELARGYAAVEAYLDVKQIQRQPTPSMTGKPAEDFPMLSQGVKRLREEYIGLRNRNLIANSKAKYVKLFSSEFRYKFTDGDFDRMRGLVNELKEKVAAARYYEDGHQQRLLQKIERLIDELDTEMISMDGFWGLVGEARTILVKCGDSGAPVVDLIGRIIKLASITQAIAEDLSIDAPLPQIFAETETVRIRVGFPEESGSVAKQPPAEPRTGETSSNGHSAEDKKEAGEARPAENGRQNRLPEIVRRAESRHTGPGPQTVREVSLSNGG